MPLPLLFIGIAAVTGATGVGTTVMAGVDQSNANKLNKNSDKRLKQAGNRLDVLRKQCGESLEALGSEKIYVLEGSLKEFVDTFSSIKNVDFTDSIGLEELSKFHIDKKEFDEVKELDGLVMSLTTGAVTGLTGGALTALGAYGLASTFATASTGTAIASLSGVAASNATLAFFGGGSLATGGLGMAGGTAVLGGLVAGPALMVMGIITSAKAGKSFEDALSSAAEVDAAIEQLEIGNIQCIGIRRRSYMFYSLLARLDSILLPLVFEMKDIVEKEGNDYSTYKTESKRVVAKAASVAVTIKSVIDTPILSEDGELVDEAEETYKNVCKTIDGETKALCA